MRTVAVVGASLAGWRAAQELREQGFDGRLVIIGAEQRAPYDRPPLSKEFLRGHLAPEELVLAGPAEQAELRAEWLLGRRATRLNPRNTAITLADGTEIRTDGVVLATGSEPRTLPGASGLTGVHQLRTVEDAIALREQVTPGSRVVVVGAGLVGSEIASTCRTLGAKVTVVELRHVPLSPILGVELGAVCASLHGDHGVRTRCGSTAARLIGDGHVTGLELTDGRVMPADLVVLAIGVRPATSWLRGSGVTLRDGVLCDSGCVSKVPNVVAVGDVARYRSAPAGGTTRLEHWANAMEQPRVAVRNLLAGSTVESYTSVPYFESEQYGVRLQFAGRARPKDKVSVIYGSPEHRKFVATYHRAGRLVATLAMNSSKLFARYHRRLAA